MNTISIHIQEEFLINVKIPRKSLEQELKDLTYSEYRERFLIWLQLQFLSQMILKVY